MGIVKSLDQSQLSVLVNHLDQNFTKGENHRVRVFATNSVGTLGQHCSKSHVSCPTPLYMML